MSTESDKPFELLKPTEESNNEPFQDFIQEVDNMIINMSPDELATLPDEASIPIEEIKFDDQSIDQAVSQAETVAINENEAGFLEMQQTFLEIMQQVLKPVTRYIKAIANGIETRELFEIINFTVTPLIEKVEQVKLAQHATDLQNFKQALTRILATHFGTLAPEMREALLKSYMEIKRTFGLDLRGNQRAVVNVLEFYRMLCFSREVEVDEIRKFFAIGIPSLTWVRRTPAQEIASLSGMVIKQAKLLRKMALAFREIPEEAAERFSEAPQGMATA